MPDLNNPGFDPEDHDPEAEGSDEDGFDEALDDLEAEEGEGLADEGEQEPPEEEEVEDLDTSDIPEGPGRDAVARWKKNYNRKMNELKQREESLGPQFAELQYKGQVLDKLLADKEINAALRKIRDRRMAAKGASPNGKADGEQLLEAKLNERLTPIQREVEQMRLDNMAAAFTAKNPDWEKYFPRMQKMWERYGRNLPYEAAYKLAKYGAVEERLASGKKKETPIRRGGTQVPTREQVKVTSFEDAVDAALVMHKIPKERFFGR